jgi:hypothetical protein
LKDSETEEYNMYISRGNNNGQKRKRRFEK